MNRILLYLLFGFIFFTGALPGYAQFLGLGWQTGSGEKDQFAAHLSLPYVSLSKKMNAGSLNFDHRVSYIFGGGVEYTTSGSKVSGLNVKPLSLAVIPTFTDRYPFTLALKADAGYNFNLTHGNSGMILSPALYLDYKLFFVSAGYDYNAFHNEGQFNVRVGIGITWGLVKSLH